MRATMFQADVHIKDNNSHKHVKIYIKPDDEDNARDYVKKIVRETTGKECNITSTEFINVIIDNADEAIIENDINNSGYFLEAYLNK